MSSSNQHDTPVRPATSAGDGAAGSSPAMSSPTVAESTPRPQRPVYSAGGGLSASRMGSMSGHTHSVIANDGAQHSAHSPLAQNGMGSFSNSNAAGLAFSATAHPTIHATRPASAAPGLSLGGGGGGASPNSGNVGGPSTTLFRHNSGGDFSGGAGTHPHNNYQRPQQMVGHGSAAGYGSGGGMGASTNAGSAWIAAAAQPSSGSPPPTEVAPFTPHTCSPQRISNWVTLNVGGTIFSTTRATLLQDRGSLLYAMFRPDSAYDLDMDEKGHVLLDADGQYFGPLLNFLRMNEVAIPPNVSNKGVLACAQYFNVRGVLDYFNRDKRQVVFSCGSGSSGELGTLDRLDVLTPSAVTIVPYNCRIVSVALGANYSCALTNNGKVYTFGNGDWGQLGLGSPKAFNEKAEDRTPIVTIPTVIPALEKKFVTAVSSGYAYAMVLTQDHEVYFWGNNNHGQSGLGPASFGLPFRKIEAPVLVETLQGKRIVQLGCGSFFVLALSADGSLYSWGLVDCLGLGTMDAVIAMCKSSDELAESVSKDRRTVLLTPHRVPIDTPNKIVKINAGQWHSCAISDKGELFTWGVGFQGRLGHGNKEPYLVPTRVGGALEGHKVVDVACGSFHTAALTESGVVFCWGDNSNGQCGSNALPEAVMLPNCVNSLCVVAGGVARSISCGRQHTAVVMKGPHQWCNNYCCQLRHDGAPQAEHGQLYVFGESKGMGLGTTQRVCVAKLVTGMEAYNISAVVSGLHHTFIVADVIPPVPYS